MSRDRKGYHKRTTGMYGPPESVRQYGTDRRCAVCDVPLSRYNPTTTCALHEDEGNRVEGVEQECRSCGQVFDSKIFRVRGTLLKTCPDCRARDVARKQGKPRKRRRAADAPQTPPPAPVARARGNPQRRSRRAREGS